MPYELRVVIPGLERMLRGAEVAPAAMEAAARDAMQLAQFAVEAEAKRIVPVVTSRLRSSIGAGPIRQLGGNMEGPVGTSVVYARMIEFGAPAGFPLNYRNGRATKNGRTRPYVAHLRAARPGRRYMRDGLLNARPTVLRLFKVATQRALRAFKEG